VSKASEDFPEPETPVITTSLSLGIFRLAFFRLCTLAPLISIYPSISDHLSIMLKFCKNPKVILSN
jgi:hypothetical protein